MKRPTSVTVFAILNIVFGCLGVCCIPVSAIPMMFPDMIPQDPNMPNPTLELMNESPFYSIFTMASLGLGFIAAFVLIAAGIGMLKMAPWGRFVSVMYAIYGLVMAVIAFAVNTALLSLPLIQKASELDGPQQVGAMAGGIGGIFGGCIAFIYPALLLYFMTRPTVIEAFEPPMEEKMPM